MADSLGLLKKNTSLSTFLPRRRRKWLRVLCMAGTIPKKTVRGRSSLRFACYHLRHAATWPTTSGRDATPNALKAPAGHIVFREHHRARRCGGDFRGRVKEWWIIRHAVDVVGTHWRHGFNVATWTPSRVEPLFEKEDGAFAVMFLMSDSRKIRATPAIQSRATAGCCRQLHKL